MKVLVVTGGFLTLKEHSLFIALQKQVSQWRASEHPWLETKIKLVTAFPVLLSEYHRKGRRYRKSAAYRKLHHLFESKENFDTPELTEVVLCGLLRDHGISYEIATYDDLFSGSHNIEAKLNDCDVVFASTTFLRDLSELDPVMARLKQAHNRIVLGGAMAGSMDSNWQGHPLADLVAIGYGEYLIPKICHWILSDFKQINAPSTGRLEQRARSTFIFSGVPPSLSLDHLPRPDWNLSQKDHGRAYNMIHYESVRGCPYRCSFCNYPFLFDDTKFRTKSALKMAQDWQHYSKETGMEFITCLDSLFTMPRRRLIKFCRHLIDMQVDVKWICYARSDDLCDESTVLLMKEAGVHQVQIGIESGDQGQLDNMNKRTRVAGNARALDNCRKAGLTTVVTLIVGFPGETQKSLNATYEFMRNHPPDFYFLATFSTRVANVPVLNPANRQRFGLVTMENERTVSPYWKHDSMDCLEATKHQWLLSEKLIANKVSLDAAIFYKGILRYDPALRADMLQYQKQAVARHSGLYSVIKLISRWCDRKLAKDMKTSLESPAGSLQAVAVADIPPQPVTVIKRGDVVKVKSEGVKRDDKSPEKI